MATPREKYNTKIYETLVHYNECNNAPFSNEKIRQAMNIVIVEEELDDHNVTVDTFFQSHVTQEENVKMILTSERRIYSEIMAETIKGLTINKSGYYNSEKNDAEGDPKIDPKVENHNSGRNKRKVTDITNRNPPQKLLRNRTLPIISTKIDPQIPYRVATCGGTPHVSVASTLKVVVTDAACSSARIL